MYDFVSENLPELDRLRAGRTVARMSGVQYGSPGESRRASFRVGLSRKMKGPVRHRLWHSSLWV